MTPKRIVITGGPGTGKTSLVRYLEEDGFLCYHEIIRDLTSEAINGGDTASFKSNPLVFVDNPYRFNQRILDGRLNQFQKASMDAGPVVFFDRGLPDVLAYMDYFDQDYGPDFVTACRDNRYDKVVILPPWEGIYQGDEERFESFEQASAIHLELLKTYIAFDYNPVTLPYGTLEERSVFVTDLIKSIL